MPIKFHIDGGTRNEIDETVGISDEFIADSGAELDASTFLRSQFASEGRTEVLAGEPILGNRYAIVETDEHGRHAVAKTVRDTWTVDMV